MTASPATAIGALVATPTAWCQNHSGANGSSSRCAPKIARQRSHARDRTPMILRLDRLALAASPIVGGNDRTRALGDVGELCAGLVKIAADAKAGGTGREEFKEVVRIGS